MRYLLSLLALLIVLSSPNQGRAGEVPGVSADKILVGMTTDLTGPLAFIGQQGSAGAQLYLEHVNEQGGVHGRQIELLVEDDGYQPPRAVAAFRKLASRDGVFCFAGNMGSATTMATLPLIKRERVPLVMPMNLNSQMANPFKRYVFAIDPSYPVQSWLMVQYIVEVEKAPAPRLGVVYQDDDYGRDGLRGVQEAAAHYNIPIVAEEGYKRGAIDFGAQTLNLRQADPTHILLWTTPREGAQVMKEAQQAGWTPQFVANGPAADKKILELAKEAATGFVGLGIFDYQSDAAPMKQYHQLLKEHTPDEQISIYHTLGYGIAQTLVEGLERVGPDLTREKLVDALETLDHWQGSVLPPVTYGPDQRGGFFASAFFMSADLQKQEMVRFTDWLHFKNPTQLVQQTAK